MTQHTPVIEASHPPDAVLKVLNPVMRLLLRSPLGSRMGNLLVLGFTGRRSGRRYHIPLSAHRTGGELFALTGAGWQHNFHGGRDVEVTLDRHTTPMRAVALEDPQEIAEIYVRRIAELGVKDAQRQIGIKVNIPRSPTVQEVTELVPRQHLAAIRLAPRP